MTDKQCKTCKETLSRDMFHKSAKSKDGFQYSCKPCAKTILKASYAVNPEKAKLKAKRWAADNPEKRSAISYAHRLKRDFNMTLEEYHELLLSQSNQCKICGSEGRGGRSKIYKLFVDHCHKTNKIRGLLCMKCNSAIGYFEDDASRMRSAIQYLERNF